jgi:Transposase IS66 family
MPLIRRSFKRLHYPTNIIAQCVRWYLAYALSLRNLEEMIAERGITVDHSMLNRWIIRLVPLLDKAFRRHKHSVARPMYFLIDAGLIAAEPLNPQPLQAFDLLLWHKNACGSE